VLIVFLADGATAQPQTQGTAVPNLSSANFGWQHGLGFGLQPVEGKIAPTKLGPAVPGVERLADDQNPNLTPWAAAQMRMHNDLVKNGHRAFSAQSRCWPGGTPAQLAFLQPFYFIQTPNVVWMIWERDHQVRRVYLNREHSENPKPSWFGESVGHYENGELVIDTIGFIEHPFDTAYQGPARGGTLEAHRCRKRARSNHHGGGSRRLQSALVGHGTIAEGQPPHRGMGLRGEQSRL
jgi:hypothetical protein